MEDKSKQFRSDQPFDQEKTAVFRPAVHGTNQEETQIFASLVSVAKTKKHSGKKIALAIGAAVVVLLGAAALTFFMMKSPAKGSGMVLLEGERLSFSVGYGEAEYISNNAFWGQTVSPAGDYTSGIAATLSQFLKKDASNSKIVYLDNISGNKGKSAPLYYCDTTDGTSYLLDENVQVSAQAFAISDDGQTIFYLTQDAKLYRMSFADNKSVVLAENVAYFMNFGDANFLLYQTTQGMTCEWRDGISTELGKDAIPVYNNSNGTATAGEVPVFHQDRYYYILNRVLYQKAVGTPAKKIADGVDFVVQIYEDGSVYYLTENEETLKYSDLIEDDVTQLQKTPVHPVIDDHKLSKADEKANEAFQALSDQYYQSDAYQRFGEDLVWYDDNGTTASKAMGMDENTIRTVDWAAYGKSLEEYYTQRTESAAAGADSAKEMLTQLEGQTFTVKRPALLYYNGETIEALSKNISHVTAVRQDVPMVSAVVAGSPDGKMKLSKLLSDGKDTEGAKALLQQVFGEGKSEDQTLLLVKSSQVETVAKGASFGQAAFETTGSALYFTTDIAEENQSFTVKKAVIENGKPVSTITVAKNCSRWRVKEDGGLYYVQDTKDNAGDLYSSDQLVSKNVYLPSLRFGKKGVLTFLTSFNETTKTGTLVQVVDGQNNTVEDKVAYFVINEENHIGYMVQYNKDVGQGTAKVYLDSKTIKTVSQKANTVLAVL